MVCWVSTCWGDGVSNWALDEAAEDTIMTIGEIVWEVPDGAEPDSLWFDARRSVFGAGKMKVAQRVDGEWEDVMVLTLEVVYGEYGGVKLDEGVTAVKFYTEFGATLNKYVKNVRVNNRWRQEIVWEQHLHNVLSGDTVVLTGRSSSGARLRYVSGDTSVCVVRGDTLFALRTGRAAITAYQDGDLFNYEAEPVVVYVNVNLVSGQEALRQKAVVVYPNPVRDGVLRIVGGGVSRVDVWGLDGRKVFGTKFDGDDDEVEVRIEESGVYVVRVVMESGEVVSDKCLVFSGGWDF